MRPVALMGAVLVVLGRMAGSADAAAPEGARLAFLKLGERASLVELSTSGPSGDAQQVIAGGPFRKGESLLPELFEAPSWSPDGSLVVAGPIITHLGRSKSHPL